MVFCNKVDFYAFTNYNWCHNPYFNRWFSAIKTELDKNNYDVEVTILILIDGFLQYECSLLNFGKMKSHNPYFNRWFSAI